ncbi:MAG: transglycosylase SLT domain-containing protein [Desulfatiglandaceae bacterium]
MENRGNKSKLPIITLVLVLCAFAAVTYLLYQNTLINKQLEEMDLNVSGLNSTLDNLTQHLEISKENVQKKDQAIKSLQQAVAAEERVKEQKTAAEQIWIASLILNLQPKIDPMVADVIASTVRKYSYKYRIPPELIVNVAMRESSFRLILESNKKAKGLMQVMASAHPEKVEKLGINNDNIFHIDNNIHMGTMILAEYYESKNSIYGALESYVGADLKSYINDILVGFADTKIEQFRAMSLNQQEKDEAEKSEPAGEKEDEEALDAEGDNTTTEAGASGDNDLQNEENIAEPSQNSGENL